MSTHVIVFTVFIFLPNSFTQRSDYFLPKCNTILHTKNFFGTDFINAFNRMVLKMDYWNLTLLCAIEYYQDFGQDIPSNLNAYKWEEMNEWLLQKLKYSESEDFVIIQILSRYSVLVINQSHLRSPWLLGQHS